MKYWCTHCGAQTRPDEFTTLDERYAVGVCHTTDKPMRRQLVNSEDRALAIIRERKAAYAKRRAERKALLAR